MEHVQSKKFSKLAITSFILSTFIFLWNIAAFGFFIKNPISSFIENFFEIILLKSRPYGLYLFIVLISLVFVLSLISLIIIYKRNLKGKLFAWFALIISFIGFYLFFLISYLLRDFNLGSLGHGMLGG